MNSKMIRLLAGISAVAVSTAPAIAQEAEDVGGIADIVVTAQKKEENLQTVPIAVSAIGGESLAAMQVTSLQALQNSVPNVQIDNFANTPNNAVFTIRGIGVIEPDPYAGNTVSIVVDGVPQFFSMGALLDTYDINRVEILRGPQGTLFGANTTGGVVNVVNEQPTGEFGGYIRATYGNWNRFDINAAVEMPLVEDTLSLRLAGVHTERKGWVTNTWNGKDMGRKNVDAVRGQLLFTPSTDVRITLQGEYVAGRNGAPVVVNGGRFDIVPLPDGTLGDEANAVEPGTFWNGAVLPMYESPCIVHDQPCRAPNKYYSGNNEVPDKSNMTTKFVIGTAEFDNTALGDITSITGYKKFTLFEYTDQDGTAKTNNATRRRTEGWQFSQELRTAVDLTDSINAIAGVFYMKTHYDHYQMYHLDFAVPGLVQFNTQDQDTESFSAFLQTYAELTDRLTLSAGIRYTHDKIDARSTLDYGVGAPELTSDNFAIIPDIDVEGFTQVGRDLRLSPHDIEAGGKKSWDNVGWKIGLDYELGTNQMIYASWARGFKSGGFTGRISNFADGSTPYNPEKVDTFEIGLKADLLDRRLRTNLAAFYTNYRNMQVALIGYDADTQEQYNRILNAAKSEIKGFEFEVQAVPVDGLTLRGSLAYLDTKYKNFIYTDSGSGSTTDLKGLPLQNAPKWQGGFGANYTYEMGDGGRIVADASYSYTAKKYYTSIFDTPRSQVQAMNYIDASLTYHSPDDRYSIGLWGKNLADKRYISTVYDSPGYMGLVGYAPPRQFGVSAGFNF